MQEDILIKNAKILNPLGNGQCEEKKASVLISEGKIAEISEDIENADAEKIIDAQDKILMPGLVNTHTHISMSLFRGLADDLALDSWLNDHHFFRHVLLHGWSSSSCGGIRYQISSFIWND